MGTGHEQRRARLPTSGAKPGGRGGSRGPGRLPSPRRGVPPGDVALARRYEASQGVERQELVQEGVAGLLFAARRYDARLNTPFWAYASFWVRKAMQDMVAELTRPVVLSDRAARVLARLRAARRAHLQAHGHEPTNAELSRATNLTLEQIESLIATDRVPRGLEGDARSRKRYDDHRRRDDRRSGRRTGVRPGARQDRVPRGARTGRPARRA